MKAIVDASSKLEPEQQSEWKELHEEHGPAKDGCDTIARWTPEHRLAIELALRVYAIEHDDARDVLCEMTKWSHRLGVWLACRVAREALRYVPAEELRPLRAIETAERWVRGDATAEECRTAAYYAAAAAYYATYAAASAAADAATYAAYSTHYSTYVANAAADAADAATYAYAAARVAELRRLCSVIASEIEHALDAIGGAE